MQPIQVCLKEGDDDDDDDDEFISSYRKMDVLVLIVKYCYTHQSKCACSWKSKWSFGGDLWCSDRVLSDQLFCVCVCIHGSTRSCSPMATLKKNGHN